MATVVPLSGGLETAGCDLCGSAEFTDVLKQTDIVHGTTTELFSVVRCVKCGLMFTNPRPTPESISRFYSSAYSFHHKQGALRGLFEKALRLIANSWVAYLFLPFRPIHSALMLRLSPNIKDPVLAFAREKSKEIQILDIGCGSGISAHFWGAEGSLKSYRKIGIVQGVEIDNNSRDVLSSLDILNYPKIEEVPADVFFDVIRMNWSLEHVHHPSLYFNFIKKHLKKDGRAFVNIPNMNGLIYKMCPDLLELPIHLYHFKREDIQRYADAEGLKVFKFRSFSYPGMFQFSAQIHPKLKHFQKMSLLEAKAFQKLLDRMPEDFGNDMIFELGNQ